MNDDRAYYERRLREEVERADTAPDYDLRTLHARWADLYRERLRRMG